MYRAARSGNIRPSSAYSHHIHSLFTNQNTDAHINKEHQRHIYSTPTENDAMADPKAGELGTEHLPTVFSCIYPAGYTVFCMKNGRPAGYTKVRGVQIAFYMIH